jgi:hypothetical protein
MSKREDEIKMEYYVKRMLDSKNKAHLVNFWNWAKKELGPPPETRLKDLPVEVFQKITQYLPGIDKERFSRASRQNYSYTDKSSFIPHLSSDQLERRIRRELLEKPQPDLKWVSLLRDELNKIHDSNPRVFNETILAVMKKALAEEKTTVIRTIKDNFHFDPDEFTYSLISEYDFDKWERKMDMLVKYGFKPKMIYHDIVSGPKGEHAILKLKWAVNHGFDINDINRLDLSGETPLDVAISLGSKTFVKFLNQHGAKTSKQLN